MATSPDPPTEVPIWMKNVDDNNMSYLMKFCSKFTAVDAKRQFKIDRGSTPRGSPVKTPPKAAPKASPKKSAAKATPPMKAAPKGSLMKTVMKVAPKASPKMAPMKAAPKKTAENPLSMTAKCIHARAYHKARRDAERRGVSHEKALAIARVAAKKAVRDELP